MTRESWTFSAVAALTLGGILAALPAAAAKGLEPEKVFVADSQKTRFYVPDGLVVGGDEAIDDVVVLDIRHAVKKGFERMVIDLEGNRNGESASINRPPYYHVAVSPVMNRLVFTIWGKPKLAFDAKKVKDSFKGSKLVKKVELLPVLERDRWSFIVHLKDHQSVEVFELSDPVRVIADIRGTANAPAKKK